MNSTDRVGGLLILAFSLGYASLIPHIELTQNSQGVLTAQSMPLVLAVLSIAGSLWLIVKPGPGSTQDVFKRLDWFLALGFCLLMSAYALAIRPAGFLISTALFLAVGFILMRRRTLPRQSVRTIILPIVVAMTVTVCMWLLMSELLGIYIPPWPSG